MNWADVAILIIIAASAVISLFRGFVREVLSLLAWVTAIWVAFAFTEKVAALLIDYIELPSGRMIVAFVLLLVIALLLCGLINFMIGRVIEKTGLSGTDRALGIVFGIVRGVAVVGIIVLLAGLTPVPKDPWWLQSQLLGHFEQLAMLAINFMPPEMGDYFNY